MSSSKSNIRFSDLINYGDGDLTKILFPYLNMQDLLKLRLTSSEIKKMVELYITGQLPPILSLPTGIRYNRETIDTIAENINDACSVFIKEPHECTIGLECEIFYNQGRRIAESDPPLAALREIGNTRVKISLKVFFDVEIGENYQEAWISYNHILAEVLSLLPCITTLNINFSYDGNLFDRTAIIIGELQYLSSLIISGRAPWRRIFQLRIPSLTGLISLSLEAHDYGEYRLGKELIEFMNQMIKLRKLSISSFKNLPAEEMITCLSSMRELISFSVNDIYIINSDSTAFGKDLCRALPKLSFLRLTNSEINDDDDISAIIPNIIPLLKNLTTLYLSSLEHSNSIVDIANYLKGNMPKLTSLNLSLNLLNPECITALLPTLGLLGNLEELDISYCDIDSVGLNLLIPVLKTLPSLSSLNMAGNKLNRRSINLLRMSLPRRRLKNLDTSDNDPDEEDEDEYLDLEELD